MGKSLNNIHKDLQRERIKREIMNHVERRAVQEIATGLKGVVLLCLKKEGWGQARAVRLWNAVEAMQLDILEGRITWEDVFAQVREEYRLEVKFREDGM